MPYVDQSHKGNEWSECLSEQTHHDKPALVKSKNILGTLKIYKEAVIINHRLKL